MWSLSAALARTSARAEASLSTYGFNILFLVIYGVSIGLMFLWGFQTEFKGHAEQPPPFRWCIAMARGAGYTLNINCALIILLASRLFLTGLRDTALADVLPLDKAFPALHIVVAYTAIAGVLVHVPFHFGWIARYNRWVGGLWGFTMTVGTGSALLIVFAVLYVFARPEMRKKNFRLFYAVHLIGACLFFVLLIFHGMYNQDPETYKYVIPPLIIYILDRIVRRMRMASHNIELSAENSSFKDDNILQLTVPKPFDFRPGQYAEIMVPSINREWHPFTIASAQYERNMSFFIKSLGDWTGKLHEEFHARLSGEVSEPLRVTVRGPFGAPTQQVDKYQRVFLVSGGIGATPFTSICKQLHHLHEEKDAPLSSSHRARKEERAMLDSLLADGAEQRIRSIISAIFDVNAMALGKESEASGDAQVQRLASMLRATSMRSMNADKENGYATTLETGAMGYDGVDTDDSSSTDSSSENSTQDDSVETSKPYANASKRTPNKKVLPPAPVHAQKEKEISFAHQVPLTASEKRARLQMVNLGSFSTNLLLFLHTSRVTFMLVVLTIFRAAVVVTGSIFKSSYVSLGFIPTTSRIPEQRWVPLVYAIISAPICAFLFVTIMAELVVWKGRMFGSVRRLTELFVFGPLVLTMTGIEFWRWAAEVHGGSALVLLQYLFAQGALFLLLLGRMWRAIGKRGLLSEDDGTAQVEKSGHLPDADFVWTTPTSADDMWLRQDICGVTNGRAVRLHRYVTRGKESDKNVGCGGDAEEGHGNTLAEFTELGRPDWDKLLSIAARDTRSDGVVGIFFCGPHKMGQAVRQSARRVEMWSNLRDAYLRSTDVFTLMTDLGLTDASVVRRLRKYGCRIRFVFHEENFS